MKKQILRQMIYFLKQVPTICHDYTMSKYKTLEMLAIFKILKYGFITYT
jgi:hypothetical protein